MQAMDEAMQARDPYAAPAAAVRDVIEVPLEYVGFWMRAVAAAVDFVLVTAITAGLSTLVYGMSYWSGDDPRLVLGPADLAINWVMPAVGTVAMWLHLQSTPGKMLFGARVVDARTGGTLSAWQAIGRYLAYIPSIVLLGMGYLMVGVDPRKQGLHDRLARTVVVRPNGGQKAAVVFE